MAWRRVATGDDNRRLAAVVLSCQAPTVWAMSVFRVSGISDRLGGVVERSTSPERSSGMGEVSISRRRKLPKSYARRDLPKLANQIPVTRAQRTCQCKAAVDVGLALVFLLCCWWVAAAAGSTSGETETPNGSQVPTPLGRSSEDVHEWLRIFRETEIRGREFLTTCRVRPREGPRP